MTTQPTQNPVPSELPRDLKFNAGKIDEFVTSLAFRYQDRLGGEHYTLEGLRDLAQQAIAQYGWIPIGTFQDGATISLPNQILLDNAGKESYRWDGRLPKEVASNSTPASAGGVGSGAWISVGSSALRDELASAGGDKLIGTSFGGTVYSDYAKSQYVKSGTFGAIATIPSARHAVFNTADFMWYVPAATSFPASVPSAPDSA